MRRTIFRISLLCCLVLTLSLPAAAAGVPLPYLVKDSMPGMEPEMDITGARPFQVFPAQSLLYFFPEGTWVTNGVAAGTHSVTNSSPCWLFSDEGSSIPVDWGATVGNVLYYNGGDCHLWRTDGTAPGTWRVKYLNSPSAIYGNPGNFARLGNSVVFAAWGYDGTHSSLYNLWVSDGTGTGTKIIKQIHPDFNQVTMSPVRVAGSLAYFITYGDNRLWRTDGTTPGSFVLADFPASSGMSGHAPVEVWNGLAFFTAPRGEGTPNEIILWQSNGTPAGTQPVDSTNPPVGSSNTRFMLAAANDWLYVIHSYQTSLRIYKTQGNGLGGVSLVADLTISISSAPAPAAVNGNRLYFVKDGEIWQTDGTSDTTLKATQLGDAYQDPKNLLSFNGILYFTASDNAHGTEPWMMDEATGQASMIMDINPGVEGSEPAMFTRLPERLFFYAYEPEHGQELWAINYLTNKVNLPMIKR